MQTVINEELDRVLEGGTIERSNSLQSSLTVIEKKKDRRPRFCLNFRQLNEVTEKDAYPLPFFSAILNTLRRAKYSTIDLKEGYWKYRWQNKADR